LVAGHRRQGARDDERLPGKRLRPGRAFRRPVVDHAHADRSEAIQQRLIVRLIEEGPYGTRHDRTDIAHLLEFTLAGFTQAGYRAEVPRQRLCAALPDVADAQAVQQAPDLVLLARLDFRNPPGRDLLTHPTGNA